MLCIDGAVIGCDHSGFTAAHASCGAGCDWGRWRRWAAGPGRRPRYFYDSLTLFSPARCSSLSGAPLPGADRDGYRTATRSPAYVTAHAARLDAEVRITCGVSAACRARCCFTLEPEGGRLPARGVVAPAGPSGVCTGPHCGLARISPGRCCTPQLIAALRPRSPAVG